VPYLVVIYEKGVGPQKETKDKSNLLKDKENLEVPIQQLKSLDSQESKPLIPLKEVNSGLTKDSTYVTTINNIPIAQVR
jgi:hypothetical protein